MGFPRQASASQSVSFSPGTGCIENRIRFSTATAPHEHQRTFSTPLPYPLPCREKRLYTLSVSDSAPLQHRLHFNNFFPLENPISFPISGRFCKIKKKNISRSGSNIRFQSDDRRRTHRIPLSTGTSGFTVRYRSTPHCVSITLENPINISLQGQNSHEHQQTQIAPKLETLY